MKKSTHPLRFLLHCMNIYLPLLVMHVKESTVNGQIFAIHYFFLNTFKVFFIQKSLFSSCLCVQNNVKASNWRKITFDILKVRRIDMLVKPFSENFIYSLLTGVPKTIQILWE